jgi:peptidyl-dipeptidase Dcp
VEFPSQYNEMWAVEPRVLDHYARHHQTGAAMPRDLLNKVLAARRFNQGFATTEYLAAAVIDQALHQLPVGATPSGAQLQGFESLALARAGLDFPAVPPRYRSTYFSHIFSGGYSAGYYAYVWSEVLARAAEHWFSLNGGLTRANGDWLRNKVLSRGFSADALSLFRDFYGRDPDIGPLLEARGLTSIPN